MPESKTAPKTDPNAAIHADEKLLGDVRLRPEFASDDVRKQAALYFASGWGYARTAKALKLPVNTVRDWNRAYKEGKFNLKVSVFVYDEAFRKKVTAMRRAGASWREIKEKTGISPATVMRWMRKEDDEASGSN